MMTGRLAVRCIALAVLTLIASGCANGPGQGTSGLNRAGAVETYVKGVYAYQAGQNDQAVEVLKQALQANPQLIMPRVMLGKIYKDRGDYSTAKDYYETLVVMDPYDPQHHYNLGLSYQMLQRLQDAAKSYGSALRLRPNDFGSNMNLGLVYLSLGKVDTAVEYTQRADELRPESAEAQVNLAIALDGRGDYVLAERGLSSLDRACSAQAGTLINYGNNLLAQQKWRDAEDVFQQTLKLEDTPYLHKRLGDAYALGQQYDDALEQYRVATQRNGKYFSAMNEQARVLLQQYQASKELDEKRREEALALLRQSLDTNPIQPTVKAMLEEWEKRMFSK